MRVQLRSEDSDQCEDVMTSDRDTGDNVTMLHPETEQRWRHCDMIASTRCTSDSSLMSHVDIYDVISYPGMQDYCHHLDCSCCYGSYWSPLWQSSLVITLLGHQPTTGNIVFTINTTQIDRERDGSLDSDQSQKFVIHIKQELKYL